MKNIQLQSNGDYKSIVKASGKRITTSMLEIGKTYLHQNHIFLRTITEFSGKSHVYYTQFNRVGYCSKQHFAKLCPNEATKDEIEFLEICHDKQNLRGSFI